MTTLLNITEDVIRGKVTAKSFERGVDYHRQGAVAESVRRGNRLFASVQGSEWEPYQVSIAIEGDDFAAASCTCPYDWEGYCKHIVAAALNYINPDDDCSVPVSVGTPIVDLLNGLDVNGLRALVHRLIDADPALADIVDDFCGVRRSNGHR